MGLGVAALNWTLGTEYIELSVSLVTELSVSLVAQIKIFDI